MPVRIKAPDCATESSGKRKRTSRGKDEETEGKRTKIKNDAAIQDFTTSFFQPVADVSDAGESEIKAEATSYREAVKMKRAARRSKRLQEREAKSRESQDGKKTEGRDRCSTEKFDGLEDGIAGRLLRDENSDDDVDTSALESITERTDAKSREEIVKELGVMKRILSLKMMKRMEAIMEAKIKLMKEGMVEMLGKPSESVDKMEDVYQKDCAVDLAIGHPVMLRTEWQCSMVDDI